MKNRFARMKFFIFHSFVRDKGMTIKSVFFSRDVTLWRL